MLKTHPRLTFLDLSHNQLSKAAGEALLGLIKANPNLINVNYARNNIDVSLRLQLKAALDENIKATKAK